MKLGILIEVEITGAPRFKRQIALVYRRNRKHARTVAAFPDQPVFLAVSRSSLDRQPFIVYEPWLAKLDAKGNKVWVNAYENLPGTANAGIWAVVSPVAPHRLWLPSRNEVSSSWMSPTGRLDSRPPGGCVCPG